MDGSPVTPRRTVVALTTCNNCHSGLSLHGENRNQIEMCVLCHNPSENDASQRPAVTNAVQKALPPQSVNFALMIHNIHTGEGHAGAEPDVRRHRLRRFESTISVTSAIPSMSPTGAVGNTQACNMCHVEQLSGVAAAGQISTR